MDDLGKQVDEIEALNAIYGSEWQTEDAENRSYSINITDNNKYVRLYIKLPKDYPSTSSPLYEISAPHLSTSTKQHLGNLLENLYLSYVGQTVLFQWIEKIREELQSDVENKTDGSQEDLQCKKESANVANTCRESENNICECPIIIHGEVICDRKSTFQGHAAEVNSLDQVRQVLRKLLENKKIVNATHNIHAYRIYLEHSKCYMQDCDNDGESQAGSRLLHLLEIINAKNVLVVVSRWYGGIHLGPDRFKHINNAARQVLLAANLIPNNKVAN